MKFSDIPTFTRCNTIGEHVALHRLAGYVQRQIDEFDLVLEPDFQRGRVWTVDQKVAYVEFMLRGGKSGRDIYFNDSKLTKYAKAYKEYVCVDGLQRLSALLGFTNNEFPVFGFYYNEFEGKPDVSIYWHVNDLNSRKDVLQWYLEMNTGGTPHTTEELERVKRLMEAL